MLPSFDGPAEVCYLNQPMHERRPSLGHLLILQSRPRSSHITQLFLIIVNVLWAHGQLCVTCFVRTLSFSRVPRLGSAGHHEVAIQEKEASHATSGGEGRHSRG